jgi:6,7-dimethyl-8-ribityllumazine synthase
LRKTASTPASPLETAAIDEKSAAQTAKRAGLSVSVPLFFHISTVQTNFGACIHKRICALQENLTQNGGKRTAQTALEVVNAGS